MRPPLSLIQPVFQFICLIGILSVKECLDLGNQFRADLLKSHFRGIRMPLVYLLNCLVGIIHTRLSVTRGVSLYCASCLARYR